MLPPSRRPLERPSLARSQGSLVQKWSGDLPGSTRLLPARAGARRGEPVAGVLAPAGLDRQRQRVRDRAGGAVEIELDLGEGDVAPEVRVDGLVDGLLDREAQRDRAPAALAVEVGEEGLLAGGQDAARDVEARRGGVLEIDAEPAGAGGGGDRGGEGALVADRADPAGGQDRRAAIVGEDRRVEVAEGSVERGAAGDELAAPDRAEGGGVGALGRGESQERGLERGVVVERDEDDRAVRGDEALRAAAWRDHPRSSDA